MRIGTLFIAATLGAGWANAQAPTGAQDKPGQTGAALAQKIKAEVVLVDPSTKTITVKAPEAQMGTSPAGATDQVTLRVEGKAIAVLKEVKPRDRVTLTCRSETASATSTGPADVPSAGFAKGCTLVTDIMKPAAEPQK